MEKRLRLIESARRKYKPAEVKFLLIAEAPPKIESDQFFYFESVNRGDSLFLETMRVLYPSDYSSTRSVRQRKRKFLRKFQKDGFYLIDASDRPMEDTRKARKKKQIEESLPVLIRKIKRLVSRKTKLILISATVYEVCCARLKSERFNVINDCMIDFPVSGRQVKFRDKMSALLGT